MGSLLLPLPSLPGKARLLDPEPDQPRVLDLGDIHGLAVGPAEAEVRGHLAQDVDLVEDLALRRHDDDGTLAVASDVQVALDVAPHAVEAVVGELADELLLAERAVPSDWELPDVALDRLVHVQPFAVGTDLDPVGR